MPAHYVSPLTAAYLPFSAGDLLGPFLISQAVYFFVIYAVLLVLMARLLAEFQLRAFHIKPDPSSSQPQLQNMSILSHLVKKIFYML